MATDHRARYAARKLERRCVDCGVKLYPSEVLRCDEDKDRLRLASKRYRRKRTAKQKRRDRVNQTYQAKRAAGLCVVSGCKLAAAPGHVRCDEHHDYYRQARLDLEARHAA